MDEFVCIAVIAAIIWGTLALVVWGVIAGSDEEDDLPRPPRERKGGEL